MISGGQFHNQDKPEKDAQKNAEKADSKDIKEKSFSKLTPEQANKTRKAAAAVIQEMLKSEGKKHTPRFLWYFSGCILLVIIGIIASFLIPLLSMVSNAKEVVTQHLTYLQQGEIDKAFELCDKDSLGSRYILNKILNAKSSIKTSGMTDEFKDFAKELMRDKYSEKNAQKFLKELTKDDLHHAIEFCDVDYFAKIAHDETAKIFVERLDKSPFEVQKFSTVETPPAVRGQFVNNGEYFTYNVFNNETWKISNFRLGFPVKKDE